RKGHHDVCTTAKTTKIGRGGGSLDIRRGIARPQPEAQLEPEPGREPEGQPQPDPEHDVEALGEADFQEDEEPMEGNPQKKLE
ncbi:hypothetical protein A2U01_0043784, partial [Trifolium medium]|nr:hypothetical protein [Trifolium medium]